METKKDWRTVERERLANEISTETYVKEGCLYWKANNAPVPAHVFVEAGVSAPVGQAAAEQSYLDVVLGSYRKRMANHKPSAEELCEMRAAFGPGTTVVNVLTGKRTRV